MTTFPFHSNRNASTTRRTPSTSQQQSTVTASRAQTSAMTCAVTDHSSVRTRNYKENASRRFCYRTGDNVNEILHLGRGLKDLTVEHVARADADVAACVPGLCFADPGVVPRCRASAEYPAGGRGVAAIRPRTIHVSASPRPASDETTTTASRRRRDPSWLYPRVVPRPSNTTTARRREGPATRDAALRTGQQLAHEEPRRRGLVDLRQQQLRGRVRRVELRRSP